MKNETLSQLTQRGKNLFEKLAKAYAYNGIDFVMTDIVPQRGGILSEAVDNGATAYIAGGQAGQQFFSNIPQYAPDFDTFTTRSNDAVGQIVECLPQNLLKDKVGLFLYLPMGDRLWSKALTQRTGSRIVATNEQNFRSYFEEKTNLSDILKAAGLGKHVIPSEVIRHNKPLSAEQAANLYEQYVSQDGKIVVQYCGDGCTEKGGGYSTRVIDSFEEFVSVCAEPRDSYMKVAKFISGCNSNLSICAGNLVPAPDMLGAVKNNLTEDESRYSGSTIYSLLHRARQMGINEDNVIVSVQPGTLKVVGAPQLTSISTNGVGNQLNYNYQPEILDSIYNLGERLGTLMALCGKVGLCGADLIITKEGEIFVNEINDRQQGPTESAGLNNEAHGLPALHRTAFILNFADLKNPEVSSYLGQVGARAREIYDTALTIPSPFYIKFISKYSGYAKQDVKAGNYALTQNEFGEWQWKLGQEVSVGEGSPVVDLTTGSTAVNLGSVSMNKGDFFPKENQLLRINGVSMPGSMPFSINEDGKSVLSPDWVAPIEALYECVLAKEEVKETVIEDATEVEPTTESAEVNTQEDTVQPVYEADRLDYIAQIAKIINRRTENSAATQATEDVQ